MPHIFAGNKWISFNKRPQKGESEPRACATEHVGCHDLIGNATSFFSLWLQDHTPSLLENELARRANLTPAAVRYHEVLGANVEDLFYHVLATLHDPAYRHANAGALKMEWPRIPLPGWPTGDAAGAADALAKSAARGRKLAPAARLRHARPRRHRRRTASRGRRYRRTVHHRRPQHGRRRLRPHRRLGPLRLRRRRHARPGPRRPARLRPRRNAPPWPAPHRYWEKPPTTSTSTPAPTGATSPPASGPTS